jgi:uncharacterized protein YidB (DUF937 family)
MPNRRNALPTVASIINQARTATRYKNYSHPVEDGDYGMLLMFREYQFQRSSERGFSQIDTSNVTDTIFLPVPANISDSLQVRVQRFDQGTTGDVVSSLLSEIDTNSLGITDLTGAIVRGAIKNLPGVRGNNISDVVANLDNDLAFLIRRGVDSAFPNQGRNIDAGTGTFVNPKAALSFEGVEMKSHNFDWTIAPKNEQESENLRLISEAIKRNILPSYINTSVIQRALFKYPSMVDVFFVGLDPAHYFYFKTCMVQQFNTNFTPNGTAVLKGGRPAMVQMQMNLIETDIHTSEDYGGAGRTVPTEPTITNGQPR